MGFLRLLLAMVVVIGHTPTSLHGQAAPGSVAVQAFFIISGFYIALILNRKYSFPGATPIFYQQRYLRLVPMYWLSVLATLLVCVVYGRLAHAPVGKLAVWAEKGGSLSFSTITALCASQVSMFGLDGLMFAGIGDTGHLFFTADWAKETLPAVRFMLVPPAWSLSVELLFYLSAPFLVRRSIRFQLGLVLASFALRIGCMSTMHLADDPWNGRFFPFEVALFLLGSLAYRALPVAEQIARKHGALRYVLTVAVAGTALFYSRIPVPDEVRHWAFLGLVLISVPLLFAATQRDAVDRWIGEMSYPLYLIHQVSGYATEPLLRRLHGAAFDIAALFIPLAAAALVYTVFERPFEKWRAERFERMRPKRKSEAAALPA